MLKGPNIHMETLLYGKVTHLYKQLKEHLRNKENDNLIVTIQAADTPESPEEALEALEESCQPDNNSDDTLWSRVTASEMEQGQVEYIR
jgi:hypothetical protein